MQEAAWARIIDVGLESVVQSQETNDAIKCTIRYISEDCTAAVVVASDPRLCTMENVELRMFLPTEWSPIKCSGIIVRHSQDDGLFRVSNGHVARVFITNISRMDMRRLDLFVTQKKAFISTARI